MARKTSAESFWIFFFPQRCPHYPNISVLSFLALWELSVSGTGEKMAPWPAWRITQLDDLTACHSISETTAEGSPAAGSSASMAVASRTRERDRLGLLLEFPWQAPLYLFSIIALHTLGICQK